MAHIQYGTANSLCFKSNHLVNPQPQLKLTADIFTKSAFPSNPALNQIALYQSRSHASALRFGKTYLKTDELRQYMGSIRNKDIEGYERHIVKLLNMGGTYGTTAEAKKQAEASFKELLGKLLIEDREDEHETRWQDFFMLHQQEQQQGKNASLEPFVHKQYPYQESSEPAPVKPERAKPETTGSFANLQRQIFAALKAQNQSAARRAFMELGGNNRYKAGFDRLWAEYQKNPDQVTCVIPYLYPGTLFIERQNYFEAPIDRYLNIMLLEFKRKHEFETQKALHEAEKNDSEAEKADMEAKKAEEESRKACAKAHAIYKMLEGDAYQVQNWRRLLETLKEEKRIRNIGRFRNIEAWS